MTDEEKKAIEYLKRNNIVEIQYDDYGLESIHRISIDEKQTILNLIEKQQKEIEELKENMRKRVTYCNELEKDLFENCSNYVVSKAKIKAFIKEELPDDEICSCCEIIDVNGVDLKKKLQSLLEGEE